MRATQNPNAIDSTAINITTQEFMTPLTLCNVNGSSSFTSIEGEPFSPAELAAIFALSKAQATVQAEISANHSATHEPPDSNFTLDAEEATSGDEDDDEYPPPSWNRRSDYGQKRTVTSSRMKSGKGANEDTRTGNFTPSGGPSNSTRSSLSSVRGYPPTIKEEGGDSEEEAEEDELIDEVVPADYEMECDVDDGESDCTGHTSPDLTAAPYPGGWAQSTSSYLRHRSYRKQSPSVRVAPYDTRTSRSPPSSKADKDRRTSVRGPTKRGRRSRPKPDFPKAPSRRPGIAEGSFYIPSLPSPIEPLSEERVRDLQNMFDKVILALSMAKRPCRKDELVWMIEKLIPEHRNPGWRGWENTLSQCLSMEPNLIAFESDYVKGYHWWIHAVPHTCTPDDLFKEKPPGKYPYGSGANKNGDSKSSSLETTPEPQRKPTPRTTAVPKIIPPAPRSSTRKSLAPKA